MADGVLNLYTDASVVAESYRSSISSAGVQYVRSRVGPTMGGWIGWHNCDPSSRPTIVGQAYLGRLGTQQAEFMAAIHGLHASLAYTRTAPVAPAALVLYVDNKTVALTLNRVWTARSTAAFYEAACEAIRLLQGAGVRVSVQKISERDTHHKKAHRLSKGAWNQVLFDQSWRPTPVQIPKPRK